MQEIYRVKNVTPKGNKQINHFIIICQMVGICQTTNEFIIKS